MYEVEKWTPKVEANVAKQFESRVQVAVAKMTADDIHWLTERLHAERGQDWIDNRPNFINKLQAVFDERQSDRLERVAGAIEDEDAEKRRKRLKNTATSDLRLGQRGDDQQWWDLSPDREERRRVREATALQELQEIFESFMNE